MHSEWNFYQGILVKRFKSLTNNIQLVFVSLLLLTSLNSYGQQIDPVIKYYLSGSDSVFSRHYIFNTDSRFAFTVKSIFYKTNYRGELKEADTAAYRLYYDGHKRDSIFVLDSAKIKDNVPPANFDVSLPTDEGNLLYFFPNDTGAGKLAIGFESADTAGAAVYSGFMNIDRDNFRPITLLSYNLKSANFDRLSQTYNFEGFGPFLTLSRYEMQGIKSAFMGKSYITRTMILSDYELR